VHFFWKSVSIAAEHQLHLLVGCALLVLLEQRIAAAHAPVIRLGQAGTVRAARGRAQVLPVLLSGPEVS
jgi:hypothetical protein